MTRSSAPRSVYELLSSMRFAISLLTLLAIASIVGTVLKQNEPYNNYLNQFGQFWFPVFETLGLYSVYGAAWFLLILAFLVVSTSLCLYRQTPQMLREMRNYREHAKELSLRQFAHQAVLATTLPLEEARTRVLAYLQGHSLAARADARADGVLIAAKAGSWNRLGYFLAHGAIVLICLGGLLDGNLPLKLRILLGDKRPTQGGQLIAELPASSRLDTGNWSYRGNVFIPEGRSNDMAVLNIEDGILLQELPFSVSLKKFTIEHYSTGAPKRFASDIILTDKASGESFEHTIEVNKPLEFSGVNLYQASFDDGGSRLKLRVRSLLPGESAPLELEGVVGEAAKLTHPRFEYTVEFTGFRAFNIENMANAPEADSGGLGSLQRHLGSAAKSPTRKDMRNVGPSFQFKLRDASGQAREYFNYMLPVEQDGRRFILTGMRSQPSEGFRFLRMPVDEAGGIDTFLALRNALLDPALRAEVARRFAATAMRGDAASETMVTRLTESAQRTLDLFAEEGYAAMGRYIERAVPKNEQDKAADVFVKILQGGAWEAWQLLREKQGKPALEPGETQGQFIRDSLNAISDSFFYGAPVYLELAGFEEVKASVLQATRSPGKPVVYLGSALLVLGVMFMLYVRERRLFVLLKNDGEVLFAMSSNRKTLEFEESFRHHAELLRQTLQGGEGAGK